MDMDPQQNRPTLGVTASHLYERLKYEPALILGAIAAGLLALSEQLAAGVSWRAALPFALAWAIRQLVVPAHAVEELEEDDE